MTAIAGCVAVHGSLRANTICRAMLRALPTFVGTSQFRAEDSEELSFGRSLSLRVPEDRFDHQPLSTTRYVMIADVRLDNRNELAATLYGNAASARRESDADILLAAWEKCQHETIDRLVGDFAFAVYDRA